MRIAGIDADFYFGSFRTLTERLYEGLWHQVANGEWRSSDLGSTTDSHSVEISYEGTNSEVKTLERFFKGEVTRYTGFGITCEAGEELFGCEFDYSSLLTVRLVGEPGYSYTGLDWASISFKLLLVPESKVLLPTPSKPLCDIPISFGTTRRYRTGNKDIMLYDGDNAITYDGMYSYSVSAVYTLTYEEAVYLKKILLDNRTGTLTLDNTYFGFTGESDEPETLDVKVKKFTETKNGRNLYNIAVEYVF
jgi:hypothetical protein